MNTELTTVPPAQLTTLPPHDTVPVGQMMQAIIDKGITADNVTVLGQLVALHERMEQKNAERAFAAAFVALQADLPVIVASSVIQNRGKYERFEDVMRVVQPLLTKHGFSVAFSQGFAENRITETCTLTHAGGHSRSNSFGVRSGKADTDTQADCKASTTAKRNSLLNCLNIVIRQDVLQDEEGDARLEGETVTQEQANQLEALVHQTGSDEAAFLKFAGAKTYEEIQGSRFGNLMAALNKKQKP
jgi:hypothetical protein